MTLKRVKFENYAKQTVPEFFRAVNVKETEILDVWEKYEYHLDVPLTLNRVLDILEQQNDMFILYNLIPSKAVLCNRTCCGLSIPGTEHMMKISTQTNDYGLCEIIHVTIFNSSVTMIGEILCEKKRIMSRYNFNFEENYCNFLALIV